MPNDVAPPSELLLGLDFVFDAGLRKIEEQSKYYDSIDVKMGVLIGFLGALVAGFLAVLFASDPGKFRQLLSKSAGIGLGFASSLVAASLGFSFQAFRMRQFYSGISYRDLITWTNEDVRNIKKAFLPTLQRAIERNAHQLALKQKNARRAVWFVLLALIALLGTAATIVVQLLKVKLSP